MVCVSYSLIYKAIFDELNDPNIKVNVQIYKDKDDLQVLHALNNVYVNDKKYKIEGYYDTDLTGVDANLLSYFMNPPSDTFNVASTKKREKVDFFSLGTLLDNKRVCYFTKDRDEFDLTVNDTITRNTLKYLRTPMGKKALSKTKKGNKNHSTEHIYAAIEECIDNTQPIPLDVTRNAVQQVAQKCFSMTEENAIDYSKNAIAETVFHSLLNYDREKCQNEFVKNSLKIGKASPYQNQSHQVTPPVQKQVSPLTKATKRR
jgi:hypothetical protein